MRRLRFDFVAFAALTVFTVKVGAMFLNDVAMTSPACPTWNSSVAIEFLYVSS